MVFFRYVARREIKARCNSRNGTLVFLLLVTVRGFVSLCLYIFTTEIRDGSMGSDHSASATLFQVRMISILKVYRLQRFIGRELCFLSRFRLPYRSGKVGTKNGEKYLSPAEVCDLLKGVVVVGCWAATWKVDTSMMYHLVKSQSVIKLYIFYNMLEVGDRLFSAFGQDTIDALLWTATEPRTRSRSTHAKHLGTLPHLLFALAYVRILSVIVYRDSDLWSRFEFRKILFRTIHAS